MNRIPINIEARAAVYVRSRGICEACQEQPAVHLHHLTYLRAGHELPDDLRHVCVFCHGAAHPAKMVEILMWEMRRQARINTSGRNSEQETEAEQQELEEHEREHEREHQRRHEEMRGPEPAWNLGEFKASGYDADEVEQEEKRRRGW